MITIKYAREDVLQYKTGKLTLGDAARRLVEMAEKSDRVPIRELAKELLALGVAPIDTFQTGSCAPTDDLTARQDNNSLIFLTSLHTSAYRGVQVPVHFLVEYAYLCAAEHGQTEVSDPYVYRTLCAYYSSFDSRFQALMYPAPYARLASADYESMELSGLISDMVGKLRINRISMNAIWTALNLEGSRSPSLWLDFKRRCGDAPELTAEQERFGAPKDLMGEDEDARGIVRSAFEILLPPSPKMLPEMTTQPDFEKLVFMAMCPEHPYPATVADMVGAYLRNFADIVSAGDSLDDKPFKYLEQWGRWQDYCLDVSFAYAESHEKAKIRKMPTVIVDSFAAGQLLMASNRTGEDFASAIRTSTNPEDRVVSFPEGDSLFKQLAVGEGVDIIRFSLAQAAYFKSFEDPEADRVRITPTDICRAVELSSRYSGIKELTDDSDDECWSRVYSPALAAVNFMVPDELLDRAAAIGANRRVSDSALYDLLSRPSAPGEAPEPSDDVEIEASALPIFAASYAFQEKGRFTVPGFPSEDRYPEFLLMSCALASAASEDIANVSEILLAASHEPPFDPAAMDVATLELALVPPAPVTEISADTMRVRTSQGTSTEAKPPRKVKTPAIDEFCVDMTAAAANGVGECIVERDDVIDRIEMVLQRRDKPNPVLLAPAGTGKTAVVEAFARRMASGQAKGVPATRVAALDVAALTRDSDGISSLKQVAAEAVASNTILFIDEIHTLTSLGYRSLNAANVLKPLLARGDLRVIGASTEKEYNTTISKDPALSRRFAPIRMPEMDFSQIVKVLEAKRGLYGSYHGVVFPTYTISSLAMMAGDYLPSRTSPDRELEVMDTSGVIASREGASVVDESHIAKAVSALSSNKHVMTRKQIAAEGASSASTMMGLLSDVAGQQQAKADIVAQVGAARLGLSSTKRPKSVMMFAGPSGVGKTYMAHQMAQLLDLTDDDVMEIPLGDYQSRGAYTQLVGASPSYIGYDDGGILINFITAHPSGIVVLDEIDKCIPELRDMFLGIFDNGILRAGNGVVADCSGMTFICTANTGFGDDRKRSIGFVSGGAGEKRQQALEVIRESFGAPMMGRIDKVVLFDELGQDDLAEVCRIAHRRLSGDIRERYGIELEEAYPVEKLIGDVADGSDKDARSLTRRCNAAITERIFEVLASA